MRLVKFLSILALVFLAVGQARAQVTYEYVANAPSYTGTVGSTVTVNIYLQQNLNSGTNYITAGGGISTAGAGINVSNATTGTSSMLSFSQANTGFTSYLPNPGFTNPLINQNGGNNLEFAETITVGSPVGLANGGGAASNQVFLGTATITVGTGTTTYELTSLTNDGIGGPATIGGPGSDTTITNNPIYNLDSPTGASGGYTGTDAASPFTFTVGPASVPEPSSVILTGLVFAGVAFGAYRRRLKNSTSEAINVA